MNRFILLFLFFVSSLSAVEKPSVVLRARDFGMFSTFFDVLSLMQQYELDKFRSIEVNFADTGLYYSPSKGLNWWSYYFEPVKYGKVKGRVIPIYRLQYGINPWDIERRTSKEDICKLIKKYIKVKPYIINEVNAFVKTHFSNHRVVGIHYRGTDKNLVEARRVQYEEIAQTLQEVLENGFGDDFRIFIATDEQNFLDYMISLYPDKVCWLDSALRSTDSTPVHDSMDVDPFLSGKGALIDCLLLSKTDFLIRTSSNLSLVSTYFNPELPVIEVSERLHFYSDGDLP